MSVRAFSPELDDEDIGVMKSRFQEVYAAIAPPELSQRPTRFWTTQVSDLQGYWSDTVFYPRQMKMPGLDDRVADKERSLAGLTHEVVHTIVDGYFLKTLDPYRAWMKKDDGWTEEIVRLMSLQVTHERIEKVLSTLPSEADRAEATVILQKQLEERQALLEKLEEAPRRDGGSDQLRTLRHEMTILRQAMKAASPRQELERWMNADAASMKTIGDRMQERLAPLKSDKVFSTVGAYHEFLADVGAVLFLGNPRAMAELLTQEGLPQWNRTQAAPRDFTSEGQDPPTPPRTAQERLAASRRAFLAMLDPTVVKTQPREVFSVMLTVCASILGPMLEAPPPDWTDERVLQRLNAELISAMERAFGARGWTREVR